MPRDVMADLRRLPQTDEAWEGTARLARLWQKPTDRPPYRPSLVLWFDGEGRLPASRLFDDPPRDDVIWEVLAGAMRHPMPGAGRPRRPRQVYFDRPDHVPSLATRLDAIGVRCEFRPHLPALGAALSDVEQRLIGGHAPIPGLLSIPGVTPPLLGHLYAAAVEFFDAAPWHMLNDSHPMEIRCPPDAPPRYAVVMGSGGEVFGLAVYDTASDLRRMLANTSERDLTAEMSWLVLFFEEAIAMAFDDLDALAIYGWPVPDEYAYPVFGRKRPGTLIDVPTRADLLWRSGALLVCPKVSAPAPCRTASRRTHAHRLRFGQPDRGASVRARLGERAYALAKPRAPTAPTVSEPGPDTAVPVPLFL